MYYNVPELSTLTEIQYGGRCHIKCHRKYMCQVPAMYNNVICPNASVLSLVELSLSVSFFLIDQFLQSICNVRKKCFQVMLILLMNIERRRRKSKGLVVVKAS